MVTNLIVFGLACLIVMVAIIEIDDIDRQGE